MMKCRISESRAEEGPSPLVPPEEMRLKRQFGGRVDAMAREGHSLELFVKHQIKRTERSERPHSGSIPAVNAACPLVAPNLHNSVHIPPVAHVRVGHRCALHLQPFLHHIDGHPDHTATQLGEQTGGEVTQEWVAVYEGEMRAKTDLCVLEGGEVQTRCWGGAEEHGAESCVCVCVRVRVCVCVSFVASE